MDCNIERVSKPLSQVNAVKSAALRVVGPAHKVVDGYVEIIGQGDEYIRRRLAFSMFITLLGPKGKADGGGNILLQLIPALFKFSQPIA